MATHEFPEGSVVEISGVYKRNWCNTEHLVASKISKCEFVRDVTLESLGMTRDDEDYLEQNIDFGGRKNKSEQLIVTAINDADLYEACDYSGCYNKQLKEGICPTCEGSSSKLTCRVILEIQKKDISIIEATLFQKDMEILFGATGLSVDKFSFMSNLCYLLPIQFNGVFMNKKLVKISK